LGSNEAAMRKDGRTEPIGESGLWAALVGWLAALAHEQRASPKTVEAYGRDVRQFLAFWGGEGRDMAALGSMSPRDLRAFLGTRREAGVGNRSLARQIAALRGFARFLEREDGIRCEALFTSRAPKAGRSLPRPVAAQPARAMCDVRVLLGSRRATRPCWRCSMAADCASPRRWRSGAATARPWRKDA
jgi:integrase/recombinase XerC